eukprot:1145431-Pelagomonas_calceolata.AAC.4
MTHQHLLPTIPYHGILNELYVCILILYTPKKRILALLSRAQVGFFLLRYAQHFKVHLAELVNQMDAGKLQVRAHLYLLVLQHILVLFVLKSKVGSKFCHTDVCISEEERRAGKEV